MNSGRNRVQVARKLEMRDGVRLATDIYFPEGGPQGGPYPVVLRRTPYNRQQFAELFFRPLNQAGYVHVVQDVRGRNDSDGQWYPYFNEGPDGFDTIEWIAAQPWCTGKVGMLGGSYGGWVQWAAARERPPALAALVSMVCCSSFTGEWPWINGILWPGAIAWNYINADRINQDYSQYPLGADGSPGELPFPDWKNVGAPLSKFGERFARDWPPAEDWLKHPTPDGYWDPVTFSAQDFAGIDVPVLHMTGWWDGCQRGSHLLFESMVRHSPAAERQRLVIGPWNHSVIAPAREHDGIDFGQAALRDTMADHIAWFDQWLKGEDPAAVDAEAPVQLFCTGTNTWIDEQQFPPAAVDVQSWYLHSQGNVGAGDDGELNRLIPDAAEPTDSYEYDPHNPVWTAAEVPSDHPVLDRTQINCRADVLVYRSSPLNSALMLIGRPVVNLAASSDAPDTDWFAQLVDIDEADRAFLVGHGLLRARFRDGLQTDKPMRPGQVYRFSFDLTPRAHIFRAGHRLGVAITSSGAPLWSPNPNTGGDIYTQAEIAVATNSIHHDRDNPSWIELPVRSLAAQTRARV